MKPRSFLNFSFLPLIFLLGGCSGSGQQNFNNPGSVPPNPYTQAADKNYHSTQSPTTSDYSSYYSDPDSFPPTRFDR